MKRMLSGLLALCLCLSCFSFLLTASAATSGDYSYTIANDEVTITKYNGSDTTVSVPAQIDGKAVTAIGEEAFIGKGVVSVTIPEGVRSIGNYAFDQCRKLTDIRLPSSVESIGNLAFNLCIVLPEITLPKNLSTLGMYLFTACDKLTSIHIDAENENYKSVDGVLYSADGKTLAAYPTGRTGAYAIADGVETIRTTAFAYSPVTVLSFPSSLRTIQNSAFQSCKQLTEITLPEGTVSIGSAAFSACEMLEKATLPKTLDTIGSGNFSGVKSGFTIYGYTGAYAEKYAKMNNIAFVSVGDANAPAERVEELINAIGKVTSTDAAEAISAARAAYDALESDTIRSLVHNYHYLLEAEKSLSVLQNGGTIPEYMLCDVDGDGQTTVSDVVALRGIILSGGATETEAWSGDINGDSQLTVSDVVHLRMIIVQG